jgi:hypothetical protein
VLEIGNMSETIRHIGKYFYAFKELRVDQQKKQEICFQPLCEFYACPDQMLTLNGCETYFMDISDLPHDMSGMLRISSGNFYCSPTSLSILSQVHQS